jgi:hypothetical protein
VLLLLAACGGGSAAKSPASTEPVTTEATTTSSAATDPATTVTPTTEAPGSTPPPTFVVTIVPPPPAAPPSPIPGISEVPQGLVRPDSGGDRNSPYGPFGPFDVKALDDPTKTAVADAVHAYVQHAILDPLRTGTAVTLTDLLTAPAAQALLPEDRSVLTDEGVASAPDAVVDTLDVSLDGLIAADGSAAAATDLKLVIKDGATGASTTRTGSLTWVLDGGTWKIDSFDLTVERNLP